MLSELYQYGATPEDLKAQTAGEHVGQILAAKLSDMEVIFEAFLLCLRMIGLLGL